MNEVLVRMSDSRGRLIKDLSFAKLKPAMRARLQENGFTWDPVVEKWFRGSAPPSLSTCPHCGGPYYN